MNEKQQQPQRELGAKSNRILSLGLAKTRFRGREAELELLQSAFDRVSCRSSLTTGVAARNANSAGEANSYENGQAEMILIGGFSGVGKSELIFEFHKKLQVNATAAKGSNTSCSFHFLAGKYDELAGSDPFSVISSAFDGLCRKLLAGPLPAALAAQERVLASVGAEQCKSMTNLVPHLQDLLQLKRSGRKDGLVASQQQADEKGVLRTSGSRNGSSNGVHAEDASDFTFFPTEDQPQTSRLNIFKYTFSQIVQALCTKDCPVVLHLDDLQWADEASLDLLASLLTTPHLRHFMLVGTFRVNPHHPTERIRFKRVDTSSGDRPQRDHPLKRAVEKIEQGSHQRIRQTIVHLANLSLPEVEDFVASVLRMEVSETAELSRQVYLKTHGNIFFTIQCLHSLADKNILRYSFATSCWQWDETDKISAELNISDNVVDMMIAKIETLPRRVQVLLSVASFLRFAFDVPVLLDTVASIAPRTTFPHDGSFSEPMWKLESVMSLLDLAVDEGLLERDSANNALLRYKFAHDKIREASRCIAGNQSSQDALGFEIGKHLMKRATVLQREQNEEQGERLLFVAADLLNTSCLPEQRSLSGALSSMEVTDLLHLNLKAGKKAVAHSAFAPASGYLLSAVKLLQFCSPGTVASSISSVSSASHSSAAEEPIGDDRLRLKIYSLAASVELVLGHFENGERLAREVLNSNEIRQSRKWPVYLSLATGLGAQERHEESLKLLMEVLHEMGEQPKGFHPRRVAELAGALKKVSDEEILSFPLMKDRDDRAVMNFLMEATYRAFYCKEMTIFMWCSVRIVNKTLQLKQLCGPVGFGFAALGVLLLNVGGCPADLKRFGYLARETVRRTKAKEFHARIVSIATGYLEVWGTPLAQLYEIFSNCYQLGMENGDIESAMLSMHWELAFRFLAGYPLDRITGNYRLLVGQCHRYNVSSITASCDYALETLQILTNVEEDASTARSWLDDSADPRFRPSPTSATTGSGRDVKMRRIFCHVYRMQTAFYLKKFAIADILRLDLQLHSKQMGSFTIGPPACYFSCLTAMAMAQQTGKASAARKYKASAQAELKKMKQWMTSRGAINVVHRYQIMEAQFAVLFRQQELKPDQLKALFDLAVSSATRAGFAHDAALANELAGEFMLASSSSSSTSSKNNNKDENDDDSDNSLFWAKHYFTAAYDFYVCWGAQAKAQLLLRERSSWISLKELSSPARGGRRLRMSTTQKSKESVTKSCDRMISSIRLDQ